MTAARRFPFLLLDRVVEYEPQKYAVGYKNITANDNFFTGHFPDRKIMPGWWLHAPSAVWLHDAVQGLIRRVRANSDAPHAQACFRLRPWHSWGASS